MKVKIANYGNLDLNDNKFIASGGEADIFNIGNNMVAKIYHNIDKCIPLSKIKELSEIKNKNVIMPIDIVTNLNGDSIGYTMRYIKNSIPLCKFFTKTFKNDHNISNDILLGIMSKIRENIIDVHNADCIIVDLNEMNILVSSDYKEVYFIDVDSYQTPSFQATAIMDHIRDRTVKNNAWSKKSDWFSFAIISFNMLTNIHPYRGNHPSYKPSELNKRMENFASVFDKDVKLPSVVNDFSIIPKNYLLWFKDIFSSKNRIQPPNYFDNTCAVNQNITYISNNLKIKLIKEFKSKIFDAVYFLGHYYAITENGIYKENIKIPLELDSYSNFNFLILGNEIYFHALTDKLSSIFNMNGKCIYSEEVSFEKCCNFNNSTYIKNNNNFIKVSYRYFNDRIIASKSFLPNVMPNSSKLFEGFLSQAILGQTYLNIDEKEKHYVVKVQELNDHNIIDGKRIGNIIVITSYKDKSYYRHFITFDNFSTYNYRVEKDIILSGVNFSVLKDNIGVLVSDDLLQIFVKDNVLFVETPLNSSNKLFNVNGKLNYIGDGSIFQAEMA